MWLFAFIFGVVYSLSTQDKGVHVDMLFAILMSLNSMPTRLKRLVCDSFYVEVS